MSTTALVWFRRDLRLVDNPALQAAAAAADTVIPVYIHAPHEEAPWAPGEASNWWLHQSMSALAIDLEQAGAPLIIRRGASLDELLKLIEASGADSVYWNRLYEPAVIERDAQVKAALEQRDVHAEDFNAYLLLDPGSVLNKSGSPYKVFTPFWKAARKLLEIRAPAPPPALNKQRPKLTTLSVDNLSLLPNINYLASIATSAFWRNLAASGYLGSTAGRGRIPRLERRNRSVSERSRLAGICPPSAGAFSAHRRPTSPT